MHRTNISQILGIVVGVSLLACSVLFLIVEQEFRQWEQAIQADPHVAAFGDGAHAIPIADKPVHAPGDTVRLNALSVTLKRVEHTTYTINEPTRPERYRRYTLHFIILNESSAIVSTHPSVDSQMQFEVNKHMIWQTETEEACTPSIAERVRSLASKESYDCTMVYEIPESAVPLYWLYTDTSYQAANYTELAAVFQLR